MFVHPNILRTLRWTMICFLIELLVRRNGSDSPNFTSFSTGLKWDASFGPNLRQTCSRQHDRKCRLKSNQYTFITPHRVIDHSTTQRKLRPLPDHFRPCPQNTWAPYYTAARDWLKPKGVSALTDRSGVVYSTNYYLILGLRDKAAPSTSQQIPSEASEKPSDTVIHFYCCFFFIHRRALLSANQRQWSSNRANVPRTCWAKLFEPRI